MSATAPSGKRAAGGPVQDRVDAVQRGARVRHVQELIGRAACARLPEGLCLLRWGSSGGCACAGPCRERVCEQGQVFCAFSVF